MKERQCIRTPVSPKPQISSDNTKNKVIKCDYLGKEAWNCNSAMYNATETAKQLKVTVDNLNQATQPVHFDFLKQMLTQMDREIFGMHGKILQASSCFNGAL